MSDIDFDVERSPFEAMAIIGGIGHLVGHRRVATARPCGSWKEDEEPDCVCDIKALTSSGHDSACKYIRWKNWKKGLV